jgi:hypothetical protein
LVKFATPMMMKVTAPIYLQSGLLTFFGTPNPLLTLLPTRCGLALAVFTHLLDASGSI